MFNGDINQTLERIIALHDSGGDPKQLMNTMFQGNSQLGLAKTQMLNMSKGQTPQAFIMQMLKDKGVTVSEKNLQGLARIFGAK